MSSSIPPPCLPSRPSSRIRPVLISYRIPDDIATQSITCDTRYDDIRFLSAISPPHLIALQLPAPLPATPCCPTGRLKARRHPASYSLARLACLLISFHLIGSSHRLIRSARCLPALSAARRRSSAFLPCGSSISSAQPHLIGFISRPAPLPALLPAGRPASPTCSPRLSHPSHPLRSISLAHRPAPSDETSDEQAKRRMEQAIDDEKQGTTTSDASQIPQMPIPARRIASTSRITHRHPHEHAHGKTPPPSPSQRL